MVLVFPFGKNCGPGEEGEMRSANRGTRATCYWPAEPRVTEVLSKMMEVVALGLTPGPQCQMLALPLPWMGSAAALALV